MTSNVPSKVVENEGWKWFFFKVWKVERSGNTASTQTRRRTCEMLILLVYEMWISFVTLYTFFDQKLFLWYILSESECIFLSDDTYFLCRKSNFLVRSFHSLWMHYLSFFYVRVEKINKQDWIKNQAILITNQKENKKIDT